MQRDLLVTCADGSLHGAGFCALPGSTLTELIAAYQSPEMDFSSLSTNSGEVEQACAMHFFSPAMFFFSYHPLYCSCIGIGMKQSQLEFLLKDISEITHSIPLVPSYDIKREVKDCFDLLACAVQASLPRLENYSQISTDKKVGMFMYAYFLYVFENVKFDDAIDFAAKKYGVLLINE